jgi:hypothetical protein
VTEVHLVRALRLMVGGGLVATVSCGLALPETPPESPPAEAPAVPAPQDPPPTPRRNSAREAINWLQAQLIDRVKVTGFRRLGFHLNTVSGDRDAFSQGNYGGFGGDRFTDLGILRLEGQKVFGFADFEYTFTDRRFQDPQAQRFRLSYQQSGASIALGDVTGSLGNSNRFARFSRSLRGLTVGYRQGPWDFRAVTSEERGQARTVSIQGTNSAGPYYLQSNQIINGSERVAVDGVVQVVGRDYVIDYSLGAITFLDPATGAGRLISPASTIVASYESFGFNARGGRIRGAGLTYQLSKRTRLGATVMGQDNQGAGRLSTRLEKFQGFGAPSTPYVLQFEPLVGAAVEIRVDGILQTVGIDYRFDAVNRAVFFFNRFMPASNNIDVLYTPRPTTTGTGDRETWGIDFDHDFGRGWTLDADYAFGQLKDPVEGRSGAARSLQLRRQGADWSLRAGVRDVPDGFVSVETAGFNRNERAHDIDWVSRLTGRWVMNLSHVNSSIGTRSVVGGTSVVNRSRFTRTEARFDLGGGGQRLVEIDPETQAPALVGNADLSSIAGRQTRPSDWRASLFVNRANNRTAFVNTQSDAVGATAQREIGKLRTEFSLQDQTLRSTESARLFTGQARLRYEDGDAWGATFSTSLSRIRRGGTTGNGRDNTLTVRYRPSDRFDTEFRITDADAGNLSGLGGFDLGFGSGFGGNGFSSGATDPILNTAASGRTATLRGNWRMNDRLAVNGFLVYRRTTGNLSSNAETSQASFGLSYEAGAPLTLDLNLTGSRTEFLDSPLRSEASSLDLLLSGNLTPRLGYRAGISYLLAAGTSTFQQDVATYDLSLDYRLGRRDRLSFNAISGTSFGYLPQRDVDASLTYRYQIFESLALNIGYRLRDVRNRNPLVNSGAYRVRGLDITLAFDFYR